MAQKYCPNCDMVVNTHMTGGQVMLFIFLFLIGVFPDILYALFHSKKCPSCRYRCISVRKAPSNDE